MDRAPGAASATLHRVERTGEVHDQPLAYAVNAVGCTSDDVFGLADARRGAHLTGGPHLLRIPASGAVRDLGTVGSAGLRYPLAEAYAGTVDSGRLVLASGGVLREVPLAAKRPAVTRSQTLPALPYVGDWTLDPATGDLDTIVGVGRHAALVRLAEHSLAATTTPLPTMPGGDGYGGVAWTPGGVLYVIRNDGSIYRVPLANPAGARLVVHTGRAASSDAAWCEPQVASVASVPTPSPTPAAVVRPPAPVLPAPPPPPPPVVQPTPSPTPTPTPKPSPSRAVVVPPPTPSAPSPSPKHHPQRMVPASHLVAKRPSVVSKRMIPVVGGAMVAVIVAIRTTRMTRASRQ